MVNDSNSSPAHDFAIEALNEGKKMTDGYNLW